MALCPDLMLVSGSMLGASGEEDADWGGMLDRLSACITPEEAAAVRQAAVDRGSPRHIRQLHDLVAGLLVKHRLTTWPQLHNSFPGKGGALTLYSQ